MSKLFEVINNLIHRKPAKKVPAQQEVYLSGNLSTMKGSTAKKVPTREEVYSFIGQDLRTRAKNVGVQLNLNTEHCLESHCGYAITIDQEADGFVVRDMLEESDDRLSQEETLEKVIRIIEREEEAYRNRPSEEEYLRQLMEKMAFPPELTELPNDALENYIQTVEKPYDGSSGTPRIVYVKMADTADVNEVIDAIARFRNTVYTTVRDTIRPSWLSSQGTVAIWRHWADYCENVHRYLILADQLPELSDEARQQCQQNRITFGKMNGLDYHDLLEDADFTLDSEEEWGSVDDAATYIRWKWKKAELMQSTDTVNPVN